MFDAGMKVVPCVAIRPQVMPDLGIIIDYCSLWQNVNKNAEDGDSRTAEQKQEFAAGLQCIHIPYAHPEVTAIKLTGTPAEEVRTYELRGWTASKPR